MSEPLLSKAAELEFQKSCYGKCAAIKRSELRPLLDEKKLLASDLFYQALQYVISHSEKHRDYSRLGVLVDICLMSAITSCLSPIGSVSA
ncbi:hypothetical protein ACPTFF_30300 [Pseudomonas aeruginosa]|uniref:hypothetical protein n=1 Tax=Pseudomonas aeruginosa TaxID=287 RepID=UPI00387D5AFF